MAQGQVLTLGTLLMYNARERLMVHGADSLAHFGGSVPFWFPVFRELKIMGAEPCLALL